MSWSHRVLPAGDIDKVQLLAGTLITFAYDANGQRVSKVVTSGATTTSVLDVYAQGRLAYQANANNTKIASFNYDRSRVPEGVDLLTMQIWRNKPRITGAISRK